MRTMKKVVSGSVISAAAAILIPTGGMAALKCVEQNYVFKMGITRDVSAVTFVIGEFGNAEQLRPQAPIPVLRKNTTQLVLRKSKSDETGKKQIRIVQTLIPPVFFALASANLSAENEKEILSVVGRRADKNTPLQITGYTCDLGPQEVNDVLARKRANRVADLLKSHGFQIISVIGRGSQHYVTNNPAMRHLNRRVEINIVSQSLTGSTKAE